MNNFHFLRSEWLLSLPPLVLLIFWLLRRQLRSRSWQAVCDPQLLPHLLLGRSVRRANWPIWLLLSALLLAVFALAGPVWKRQPQPLFRQQSALVVLFDLSRSMQAVDLTPSRFLRARLKIADLLRQRREGQTALIVFAADAFTVTPLTEDRHTIESLLSSLDPEMMPAQGSAPMRAIDLGVDLLHQAGVKVGRLLLVTDEDRPELSLDAAKKLAQQGFKLEILGVGTTEGGPILQSDGEYFKDSRGSLILPKLNRSGLQALASAGGGQYQDISIDDRDLHSLLAGLDNKRLDAADQSSEAMGDRWREEGIWLLWPLSLLAALAFRRGWLLVLTLLLLVPPPAEAFSWSELWQTPDQQASETFEQQDYKGAAQQFQDPRWKASALYRNGDYVASGEQLDDPQTADDWYNQGNALAKAGHFSDALEAYRQTLKIDPEHDDARFNKDLVEKAQEQQKQQDQQKSKESDKNDQGEKKDKTPQGDKKSGDQQSSSRDAQNKQNGKPDDQQSASNKKEQSQATNSAAQSPVTPEKQEPPPEASQASPAKGEQKPTEDQGRKAGATSDPEVQPETSEQRESRMLLQQIPDDPGGLLRRKFLYQYRQRGQKGETDRSW